MKKLIVLALLGVLVYHAPLSSAYDRLECHFQSALMWLVALPRWVHYAILLLVITLVIRKLLILLSEKVGRKSIEVEGESPIRGTSEDRLGRSGYVDSLLEIIRQWNGEGSQVIGIYGEWGEGKTSAINLAIEKAAKAKEYFRFVRFDPWHHIDRKNISSELFRCVSGGIPIWNNVSLSFLLLSYACNLSVKYLSNIHGFSEALFIFVAEVFAHLTGLDHVKNSLVKRLRSHKYRIVVIIDDVDRLNREEAVELIRCIKTNGDLPNLTYLILTEEGRLAKMVQDETAETESGRKYLEKIVQYAHPLWPVDKDILMHELRRLLNRSIEKAQVEGAVIGGTDLEFCLEACGNLRQIKRLCFVFEAMLAYYKANDRNVSKVGEKYVFPLEINDVLRLSVLRLLCPEILPRIYRFYSDWITIGFNSLYFGYEKPQAEIEELVSNINPATAKIVRIFLEETLGISKAADNENQVEAIYLKRPSSGNFRMANAKDFRRYFNKHDIPKEVMSNADRYKFLEVLKQENDSKQKDELVAIHQRFTIYGAIESLHDWRGLYVSNVSGITLTKAIVKVMDIVAELEKDNDSKQYRSLWSAGTLLIDYLDELRKNGLSDEAEAEIREYLLANKAYALVLRMFTHGVFRFEPEIESQLGKIRTKDAEAYRAFIQSDLSCKFLDEEFDKRSDGLFIQRLFVQMMLATMPVDGPAFLTNQEYMIKKMDSAPLKNRLLIFTYYFWKGINDDETLGRRNMVMNHAQLYLACLEKVEEKMISCFKEMDDETLRYFRIMAHGYKTPRSKVVEALIKEREEARSA